MSENQITSLFEQIQQQLKDLHDENVELTEQLTSFYENLCYLRQCFTVQLESSEFRSNSNLLESSNYDETTSSQLYQTKPRSDSEPNITAHRQRIITVIEDLH